MYYFGPESGQHVEVLWIESCSMDSTVGNMLRFYPCFYCLGFESGQHVRVYEYVQICWTREHVETMFFYVRLESGQYFCFTYVLYCLGFESGQHDEIICIRSIVLSSRMVNTLRLY